MNKLVVITGASSGIGRAAAHAFASQGARLVLGARDIAALDAVVEECAARGATALAVRTDVTNSEQMRALAEQAAAFGDGRIDIWINNAGVGAVGSFEDTPLEAHEQVLQTDLLGYLRGAYVAWPYFKKQGRGTLINTLSLGSWVAQPYAAAYSASKYGLRGLSEALRGELIGYPDIHVCDIYPADLAGRLVLARKFAPGLYDQMLAGFHRHKVTLTNAREMGEFTTQLAMVSAGLGVEILPIGVVIRPLTRPTTDAGIGVAWAGLENSRKQALMQVLVELYPELSPELH
eukprot:gene4158-4072_t